MNDTGTVQVDQSLNDLVCVGLQDRFLVDRSISTQNGRQRTLGAVLHEHSNLLQLNLHAKVPDNMVVLQGLEHAHLLSNRLENVFG